MTQYHHIPAPGRRTRTRLALFAFARRVAAVALFTGLALPSAVTLAATEDLKIPNLGESSSSLFSSEFEYQLGRTWLSAFRRQAPIVDDPLLADYLENLIFKLLAHSQLEDRRIELVVVDNPDINAFAVPGGVIGVHNGLLLWAQTEDELATVLAHEIAHLSQRHFSRGVEYRKRQQPLTLAAMLASLALIAAGGGDAGVAALSATQAAMQDSALRYSRGNEQEADRIGMQTIVEAGMDPHAAPAMFERMLAASRYSSSKAIPEFLRTHPLSENRIADTVNRARAYPRQNKAPSLDYELMRARVAVALADTPEEAVQRFRGELKGTPRIEEAAQYGLTVALTAAGRTKEAHETLVPLLKAKPQRLEYVIAATDIDMASNRPEAAINGLKQLLALNPGNHPITMRYAQALMQNQQAHIAEEVLLAQSQHKPNDPNLWYLLAEVQGLSGNIVGLHRARAEYFILTGALDQAKKQLNYALKLTRTDYQSTATIAQRLREIDVMRERLDKL